MSDDLPDEFDLVVIGTGKNRVLSLSALMTHVKQFC